MAPYQDHALERTHLKSSVPANITVALLKIGQALAKMLRDQSYDLALTTPQTQALLALNNERPFTLTLSNLVVHLVATPATVTDVVNALEEKGLVVKRRTKPDRRRVFLRLTPSGKEVAERLVNSLDQVEQLAAQIPRDDQNLLLKDLKFLIHGLIAREILPVGEVCKTCIYFKPHYTADKEKPHFCTLLETPLPESAKHEAWPGIFAGARPPGRRRSAG